MLGTLESTGLLGRTAIAVGIGLSYLLNQINIEGCPSLSPPPPSPPPSSPSSFLLSPRFVPHSSLPFFPSEHNMMIITEEKGVRDVCRALQAHSGCRALVDAACSTLWSLSVEGEGVTPS